MTPEEQRIAIAEYCGWKEVKFNGHHGPEDIRGVLKGGVPTRIPDYLNDLTAMHEAEERLIHDNPIGFWWQFTSELEGIVTMDLGGFSHVHATATQRAEAFLKTVGKWKE